MSPRPSPTDGGHADEASAVRGGAEAKGYFHTPDSIGGCTEGISQVQKIPAPGC